MKQFRTETKYRFHCEVCGFSSKWIKSYSVFINKRTLHVCKEENIEKWEKNKEIFLQGIKNGKSRAQIAMSLL